MKARKITNADFVHLHNHTEYSSFDGLNKVSEFPKAAAEKGFKALAMTDHGNIGGAFKFMRQCVEVGIKPIIGSEFYLSKDRHVHFTTKKDSRGRVLEEGQTDGRKGNRHLVLIAKNWKGYQNLCRLSQASWVEGYYRDPRIDLDLLYDHSEGLICSSACFYGHQLVSTGRGLVRIDKLNLSDVIYSLNGKATKPSSLTTRYFSGKMYQIESKGHFGNINCTEDHQIYVWNNEENRFEWTRSEHLDQNKHRLTTSCPVLPIEYSKVNLWNMVDTNFSTKTRKFHNIHQNELYIDDELCYLFGLYIAEGGMSKFGGKVSWTFHIKEMNLANDVAHIIKKKFGLESIIRQRPENTRVDVEVISEEVRRLIETFCGRRSTGKFVHSYLRSLPRSMIEQILRGAFLGDGSYEIRKTAIGNDTSKFTYASVSRSLIDHIRQMSLSLGFIVSCTSNPPERVDKNNVRHRKSYYLYAYGDHGDFCKSLMNNCPNYSILSNNNFNKTYSIKMDHLGNNFLILPIKSIQYKTVESLKVFCLYEETTNAFHADGFVVHNCLSSVINANLLHGRYDQAKKAGTILKDIFKDDFYLEVMYHGIDAEGAIVPDVIKLSEELGCKCICTNDCHYCEKCQGKSQELLMAMSTSRCLTDPKHIHFPHDEFYLKSAQEMAKVFGTKPELLLNTNLVADKIDTNDIMDNLTGKMRLPRFNIPEGFKTPYDYLEKLAIDGLKALGWDNSQKHVERLQMELNDVRIVWENNRYDFATYFLIVRDYIRASQERGILTGCGRGSGFGSVLLRCLGITYGPDPLAYGLLWERFLGFDSKYFVSERDFGIDDEVEAKNAVLDVNNSIFDDDRDVEDDLGGVDRY